MNSLPVLTDRNISEGNSPDVPVRLSQSILWQMQRDFFAEQGAEVWKQAMVPRYITSNPFIANTYAQLSAAYLKDLFAGMPAQTGDDEQSIYILELGAGSGQFSFYFLKQFFQSCESRAAGRKICYVMTDASAKIVEHWQSVEQFQPYIERGVLDFACFDPCRDATLSLLISGQSLSAEKSSASLVAIANYLFDCLPHDVFEVSGGNLYESLVTVKKGKRRSNGGISEEFEAVELDYHPQPISKDAYYKNESWNRILGQYVKAEKDGAFLFPVGALKCVENMRALSGGDLLILSGDKGHHQFELTQTQEKPKWSSHGYCFTFDVNYFALSEYMRHSGGQALRTAQNPLNLNVLAFLYGQETSRIGQAYREYVGGFGPDSFYTVKKLAENNQENLSLEEIISLLRLSRYDVSILISCYERLMQILSHANAAEKERFYTELQIVVQGCFIPDIKSNAFQLGNLLAAVERYDQSLVYYRQAQTETGNSAYTEFNLGLTYLVIGKIDEARNCLTNALTLDEDLSVAKALLHKINQWSMVEFSKNVTNASDQQSIPDRIEKNIFIRMQLENRRLRLEPLLPVYAQTLFEQATPDIMRRTRLPVFSGSADALNWIRRTMSDAENYSFAVIHESYGFIGVISMSVADNAGQFFFWLGEQFWGNGFATEAMCRLLRFAFDELRLEEMQTCTIAANQPSIRVLEKLGFRRFGAPADELLEFRCGLSRFTGNEIKNSTAASPVTA
jgi:RimJ/RimL family protein N-acetyltransferase/predicted SnoaL-like aldol condensation-catalyzing enzyme